jgi:hypothetical protein
MTHINDHTSVYKCSDHKEKEFSQHNVRYLKSEALAIAHHRPSPNNKANLNEKAYCNVLYNMLLSPP